MKKFSLLVISFILCCTNVVWAEWSLSYKLDGGEWNYDVVPQSDGYVHLELAANSTYYIFTVIDGQGYASGDVTMTFGNSTNFELSNYGDATYTQLKIQTTQAAEYKFTLNYYDYKQHITAVYPAAVYLPGAWNGWAIADEVKFDANNMFVLHLAAGDYQFKAVNNDGWHGNGGTMNGPQQGWNFDGDANCTIKIATEDDYTFTYSWNNSHPMISVYASTDIAKSSTTGDSRLGMDGKADSRWESIFDDNQWWLAKFPEAQLFDNVTITWEGAYGKTFNILGSNNGTEWTTIMEVDEEISGQFPYVQSLDLASVANYQYVKFQGIKRGTGYGYSFWEFALKYNNFPVPTNVAVSATGRLTFDYEDEADSFEARIYKNDVLIHSQVVESNDVFNFIPTETGTCQVKVVAKVGENTSKESVAYDWTVEAYHVYGKSKYCEWLWNTKDAEGWPVKMTFATEKNGNVTVTLTPNGDQGDGVTEFRGGGMPIDRFKVAGADASTYFSASWTGNVVTLALNNSSVKPLNGTLISYSGMVEYKTGTHTNAWPTLNITDYAYGTKCSSSDAVNPVINSFTLDATTTTSATFTIDAEDEDDEGTEQPLTYSVSGNNDFATITVTPDAQGQFTLSDLKKNRDYSFTITVTDPSGNATTSNPVNVRMTFDATDNLALNKPAVSGCAESDSRSAAKANDGEASTSWGTYGCADMAVANIWTVDLGCIFDIDRIKFSTDGAQGAQHPTTIYASCDNINWYVAVAEQTVAEKQSYDNISVNVPARYLKLQATGNGMIAIKEFEVYGLGYSTTDNVAPQVTLTEISKTTNSATLQIDATDVDDASVSHPVKSIRISGNNGFTTIENAVLDANNQIVLDGLKENTSYQIKVLVTDRVGLTVEDSINVRVVFDPAQNLALNKPCEAGIHQDANVASRANDGNESNFWTSYGKGTSDQWWWKVDLGASFNINRVRILFNDHSGTYNLFSSEDGETWNDYAVNFTIDNDHVDYSMNVVTSTRYFKFTSTTANVGIKEFEVYGTDYNDGDEEAPVITAATLVGEAEENSAVVSVTTTDNVGVYSCRFVDATNLYDQTYEYVAGENITVTGLVPSTTYNFTITASDRAENVSEGFAMAAFTTKANDNVPHVAAPAPQHSQLEVISIYSDKFTSAVKTPFSWTSWGGATVKTEGNIGGNSYVHYVFGGHGEIGIGDKFKDVTTNEEGINVSTKKSLHIDIWSLTNDQINITLNDQTVASNLQLVAGEWTSFNIDLASFTTEHLDILTALKWMKFTACQNKTIAVDNIYFYTEVTDITLEQTADNSTIISAYNGLTRNVTLNRSFIADGYWYTLCLPFSLTAEQLTAAYGEGYDLRYLKFSYMKSEDMMYLNFEKATELQAGMPYMFKPTGTGNEEYAAKTFTGVVIDNKTPENETEVATMTGYYSPMVIDPADYALGTDDYLYHTDGTESKAFRCYFTLNPTTSAPVRARCVFNESQVVTNLENDRFTDSPVDQFTKFIYNGQLIIIRDGKVYNAQGQIVK